MLLWFLIRYTTFCDLQFGMQICLSVLAISGKTFFSMLHFKSSVGFCGFGYGLYVE